jgi:ATPase subunit of ABC transporter with duplicated ATPase domains
VSFDIDNAFTRLKDAEHLYSRLAVIVGPSGAGKSALLTEIATRLSREVANVNLELSKRMLELTFRQRVLELGELLAEVVGEDSLEPVLLDNIEMLFEPSLAQDPVRLLKGLARNRTVVAAWNGHFRNGFLTYAEPSHPEYYRTPVEGFIVIPQVHAQTGED